jgi:hypothetical protein
VCKGPNLKESSGLRLGVGSNHWQSHPTRSRRRLGRSRSTSVEFESESESDSSIPSSDSDVQVCFDFKKISVVLRSSSGLKGENTDPRSANDPVLVGGHARIRECGCIFLNRKIALNANCPVVYDQEASPAPLGPGPNDIEPPLEDGGPEIDVYEDAVLTAHLQPLELGKTLIIYHPHARKLPIIVDTVAAQSGPSSHGAPIPEPTNGSDSEEAPWTPFTTLADFEQTALFLNYNCADPQIDAQLALIRASSDGTNITLRNAKEMHRLLAGALDMEDLTDVSLFSKDS